MANLTEGTPQRSHARSNRARILAAARQELSRDPEASIEDIARAAGVVRRTLYGHFKSRQALIAALAEEARHALEQAFTRARRPDADPATAMARMTLAVWEVGDRYRMLISLARRDLGEEGVRTVLSPAREETISILNRGQREGLFADHLPAPVLAQALEAFLLTLVETNDSPGWTDPTGQAAATAALIATGIPPADAADRVRAIIGQGSPTTP
ncbi:TetR/AcrR family transcriptional regulator [Actinomadura nitritigenes]|uniref:TetR/AcrR family transcriptional regulator n=1 Tax=Actinomadura nitritigenes TaxID=134602 RepID=A0ABS3RB58_9ACTN|nr:TetR/AcrR family transcriptional regulator [Actinomadura nitritigenes]MBO2443457.1 TetR/AcrR family transcriptional regulator [Actinomadura nitritigenes]